MFNPRIIMDRGRYFYSVYIKPGKPRKHWFSFACVTLCEFRLYRPHLTCLWCRVRRAWYGKMPSKVPVFIVVLPIDQNQKHKRLKDAVRGLMLTLIGWTLN